MKRQWWLQLWRRRRKEEEEACAVQGEGRGSGVHSIGPSDLAQAALRQPLYHS